MTTPPSPFFGFLELIRSLKVTDQRVYCVGGALRDLLLSRPIHDVDFVTDQDVFGLAKRVANRAGGGFYVLDAERKIARVLLPAGRVAQGGPATLDFAQMRGGGIEQDLFQRDFTIDAMAVDVEEASRLIDPLQGQADLRAKVLRPCSPSCFEDDPVRVVRAARLAPLLGFHLEPGTPAAIRRAAPGLARVSGERKRDELFRILENAIAANAIKLLANFAALPFLIPEFEAVKERELPLEGRPRAGELALRSLDSLEELLKGLVEEYHEENVGSLALGEAVLVLGHFRPQMREHLARPLHAERPRIALLRLGLLLCWAGLKEVEAGGDEQAWTALGLRSAELGEQCGRALALGNKELRYLRTLLAGQCDVHRMARRMTNLTGSQIYHFFERHGPAGVDLCLFSLATYWGAHAAAMPIDAWRSLLEVCRALLEGWWERREEVVDPPIWLRGDEIVDITGLEAGPRLGRLIEQLREASADGHIHSRKDAERFVHDISSAGREE